LMVFDSSSGTLLFARDSEDIMAVVKARLGLPATVAKPAAKVAPKPAAKPAVKAPAKPAPKKN
ncbi:MAG: hypothetical protein ABIV51_04385, partial [Saprospiraceae bacterium]